VITGKFSNNVLKCQHAEIKKGFSNGQVIFSDTWPRLRKRASTMGWRLNRQLIADSMMTEDVLIVYVPPGKTTATEAGRCTSASPLRQR